MVYKPHYACLCQKGERRFFRILDAEIKDRNFMLDIKFRELTFMDKDAANDRIDPALFFPENSPAADELQGFKTGRCLSAGACAHFP